MSELARQLGKNTVRAFRRYGIVPPLFFQCLQKIGLIDPALDVPTQGVNLQQAEIILKAAGFREILPKELFNYFKLYLQSGGQQHIWHEIIDQVRYMKHVQRPRGCGHSE